MLEIRIANSREQMEAQAEAWDRLSRISDCCSPFLTCGWFKSCASAFGAGKEICILLAYEQASLVGVAPLWRLSEVIRNIHVSQIGFIVSPDTGQADFIITPEKRRRVLELFLAYLKSRESPQWDLVSLSQWPADSPNLQILQEMLRDNNSRFWTGVSSKTPVVSLQCDWPALLSSRSQKFRKTNRNIANRIGRLAGVTVECVRSGVEPTLLDEILALSKKSWKYEAGFAMASRPEVQQFFLELTGTAASDGMLLLWLLRHNKDCIAMEYDLACDGKVHALRADYDKEYEAYSPGAYLQYEIVKQLISSGFHEYSSGPGASAYKLHWTDEVRTNITLNIANTTARGWLVWGIENGLIPLGRSARSFLEKAGQRRSAGEAAEQQQV